jgi:hypothetical protein
MLLHYDDPAAQIPQSIVLVVNLFTLKPYLSRGWSRKKGKYLEKRGLSGTIGSQKSNDSTLFNRKMGQIKDCPFTVYLFQIIQLVQHGILFLFSSFDFSLDNLLIAVDARASLRQGELRGKVHLSHRCFALAAWNDLRLRRRQPF